MIPRSPIEMMIDKACGYDGAAPDPQIVLHCPLCQARRTTWRHWTDPEAAVLIVYPCGQCGPIPNGLPVEYFDAAGGEVLFLTPP